MLWQFFSGTESYLLACTNSLFTLHFFFKINDGTGDSVCWTGTKWDQNLFQAAKPSVLVSEGRTKPSVFSFVVLVKVQPDTEKLE